VSGFSFQEIIPEKSCYTCFHEVLQLLIRPRCAYRRAFATHPGLSSRCGVVPASLPARASTTGTNGAIGPRPKCRYLLSVSSSSKEVSGDCRENRPSTVHRDSVPCKKNEKEYALSICCSTFTTKKPMFSISRKESRAQRTRLSRRVMMCSFASIRERRKCAASRFLMLPAEPHARNNQCRFRSLSQAHANPEPVVLVLYARAAL